MSPAGGTAGGPEYLPGLTFNFVNGTVAYWVFGFVEYVAGWCPDAPSDSMGTITGK